MLNPWAQSELQAVAQAAQINRKRAVAINPYVGAPHQFFLSTAVVHGEGVQINRGVAACQGTKINGLAVNAAGQQPLVPPGHTLKPVRRMGIKALAQGGARRHSAQTQGAHEEIVATTVLDSIKVVLTQTKQAKVTFEDVAIGNP